MNGTRTATQDERLAVGIQAGMKEVESFMLKSGMSEDEISKDFFYEALFRLWNSESRDDMRAKAHSLVDEWVDVFFDNIGDL